MSEAEARPTNFIRQIIDEDLRERPGSYFLLGNGEKGEKGGCMVHNPGYDFNDDIITTGATLFARLVEKHCR